MTFIDLPLVVIGLIYADHATKQKIYSSRLKLSSLVKILLRAKVSNRTEQYMNEVWPKGAPKVGQRSERSRTVEATDIELFTRISGDRNPLHYDVQLAKSTRFGGIVVQGGIT